MKDPKTADQLRQEIAYFSQQLKVTTSRDRKRRAHIAIRTRERQLVVRLQQEVRRQCM